MRFLHAVLGQRRIMEGPRFFRIESDVKLINPTEFKPRLTHGIVTNLSARDALGQIRSVRGNLIGDDAVLDVRLVR